MAYLCKILIDELKNNDMIPINNLDKCKRGDLILAVDNEFQTLIYKLPRYRYFNDELEYI